MTRLGASIHVDGITFSFTPNTRWRVLCCQIDADSLYGIHCSAHVWRVGERWSPMRLSCPMVERRILRAHSRYKCRTAHQEVLQWLLSWPLSIFRRHIWDGFRDQENFSITCDPYHTWREYKCPELARYLEEMRFFVYVVIIFHHFTSQRDPTLHSRRRYLRTTKLQIGIMRIFPPGLHAMGQPYTSFGICLGCSGRWRTCPKEYQQRNFRHRTKHESEVSAGLVCWTTAHIAAIY